MVRNEYKTLILDTSDGVARLTLNRPEVHNAFDDDMLGELIDVFGGLQSLGAQVRAVVITGEGKSFCAGADINWMQKMIDFSYEENVADSYLIADCMEALYNLPQPTIARVNGAAIGGGMGLVTASDIAIAADSAKFSLSEVKIGLVPACISPYVIMRAGPAACREFFLTGERLTARKALEYKLVNEVVPLEKLDEAVDARIKQLKSSGPEALAASKKLIADVYRMSIEEAKQYTVEMIAKLRISPEGQEGMKAFLDKRKPNWSD